MIWASLDLAKSAGFCIWNGSEPLLAGVISPSSSKKKPQWTLHAKHLNVRADEYGQVFSLQGSAENCWNHIKDVWEPERLVAEGVRGFAGANLKLAAWKGWVARHFDKMPNDILTIDQQTWRAETKHLVTAGQCLEDGFTWDAGKWPKSPYNKLAAVQVARDMVDFKLPPDAADAYVIGLAFGGSMPKSDLKPRRKKSGKR